MEKDFVSSGCCLGFVFFAIRSGFCFVFSRPGWIFLVQDFDSAMIRMRIVRKNEISFDVSEANENVSLLVDCFAFRNIDEEEIGTFHRNFFSHKVSFVVKIVDMGLRGMGFFVVGG